MHRGRDLCQPRCPQVFLTFADLYKKYLQPVLGSAASLQGSCPDSPAVSVAGFNPECSGVSLYKGIAHLERDFLSLQACTAGLGEVGVAGCPGGCPNTTLLTFPYVQRTPKARTVIVFKCTGAGLWDISLLISDACLPVDGRVAFPSCINLIFPVCLVIFQNVMWWTLVLGLCLHFL